MSLPGSTRTNAEWVEHLTRVPPDDAAVRELRSVLRGGLVRGLNSRVSDADLDDFAQDSAMRVLGRIASYRGDSRFTTWATAVALRVAYTELRRRKWKTVSLDGDGAGVSVRGVEAGVGAGVVRERSAEGSAERLEMLEALRRAIATELTEHQRQAIVLELSGMPQVVVSERLGISRNALYKLTHDARRRLRSALERAGFDAEQVSAALDTASQG